MGPPFEIFQPPPKKLIWYLYIAKRKSLLNLQYLPIYFLPIGGHRRGPPPPPALGGSVLHDGIMRAPAATFRMTVEQEQQREQHGKTVFGSSSNYRNAEASFELERIAADGGCESCLENATTFFEVVSSLEHVLGMSGLLGRSRRSIMVETCGHLALKQIP